MRDESHCWARALLSDTDFGASPEASHEFIDIKDPHTKDWNDQITAQRTTKWVSNRNEMGSLIDGYVVIFHS